MFNFNLRFSNVMCFCFCAAALTFAGPLKQEVIWEKKLSDTHQLVLKKVPRSEGGDVESSVCNFELYYVRDGKEEQVTWWMYPDTPASEIHIRVMQGMVAGRICVFAYHINRKTYASVFERVDGTWRVRGEVGRIDFSLPTDIVSVEVAQVETTTPLLEA